ncbi:MAG: hypothetical protein AAFU53_15195, partial [Cyanobacteria bacterium J06632_3]
SIHCLNPCPLRIPYRMIAGQTFSAKLRAGLIGKRGGSWNNNPRNCRSASRNNNTPGNRNNNIGFRVSCLATVAALQLQKLDFSGPELVDGNLLGVR